MSCLITSESVLQCGHVCVLDNLCVTFFLDNLICTFMFSCNPNHMMDILLSSNEFASAASKGKL